MSWLGLKIIIITLGLFTTNPILPIEVNQKIIAVEIADTPVKITRGLSGRTSLPTDRGLLFVFDKPDRHPFWMKEMNFPIDILWLDADFKIVDAWRGATPKSYPKTVSPKREAWYVLETNPGVIPN